MADCGKTEVTLNLGLTKCGSLTAFAEQITLPPVSGASSWKVYVTEGCAGLDVPHSEHQPIRFLALRPVLAHYWDKEVLTTTDPKVPLAPDPKAPLAPCVDDTEPPTPKAETKCDEIDRAKVPRACLAQHFTVESPAGCGLQLGCTQFYYEGLLSLLFPKPEGEEGDTSAPTRKESPHSADVVTLTFQFEKFVFEVEKDKEHKIVRHVVAVTVEVITAIETAVPPPAPRTAKAPAMAS